MRFFFFNTNQTLFSCFIALRPHVRTTTRLHAQGPRRRTQTTTMTKSRTSGARDAGAFFICPHYHPQLNFTYRLHVPLQDRKQQRRGRKHYQHPEWGSTDETRAASRATPGMYIMVGDGCCERLLEYSVIVV